MLSTKQTLLTSLLALTFGTVACTGTQEAPNANAPTEPDTTEQAAVGEDLNAQLSGAGASFPAPLYQSWFAAFNEENPGVQVSYQSVGSGAGVEQYLAGTVDFGASDAPLTDEERQQFQERYSAEPVQLPMTGGAVVFAYNLPGVENLQLSRDAYCGIVTGEVTNWNDAAIAQNNPGVDLPAEPINFVHRSDGSGTTFIFTNHIAEACDSWQAGAGKSVEWPVGTGAKGNEGITAQVQQTEGSIGYVEYAYANENGLSMASLENQSGAYIEPSPDSAALIFEGEEVPQDFALTVPNPSNPEAYPIGGLTWLLLYPSYDDPNKAEALNSVIEWALNEGDQYATELGYIPLGGSVQERVLNTAQETLGAGAGQAQLRPVTLQAVR